MWRNQTNFKQQRFGRQLSVRVGQLSFVSLHHYAVSEQFRHHEKGWFLTT